MSGGDGTIDRSIVTRAGSREDGWAAAAIAAGLCRVADARARHAAGTGAQIGADRA